MEALLEYKCNYFHGIRFHQGDSVIRGVLRALCNHVLAGDEQSCAPLLAVGVI
jgi:hypothetical protein